eukprot:scaffold8093_cov174-Skeletonema_marinoi.AAC.7
MGFRQETQDYLNKECPTKEKLEVFLELSSEEIRAIKKGGEKDKEEKDKPRFKQTDRAKLILLGRWTENNRADDHDGKGIRWGNFKKKSFNDFVRDTVDTAILKEILKELHLDKSKFKVHLDEKLKDKKSLKDNGVHTPASFVEKSRYWYEQVMKLSSTDIDEIVKFQNWYKYQLDTYLPSDWIASFREEAAQVSDLEWRKVLKAIGLKADAIQALEINDICDFGTLNHRSKNWRITKKDGDDDVGRCLLWGNNNSPSPNSPTNVETPQDTTADSDWNEWKSLGLNMNDARNIINFRRWHNFYVAKKDKNDWAASFKSAHYERFVQRYVDPSKPDDYKPPSLWESWLKPSWWEIPKKDNLKTSMEKKEYLDMIQAAAEDGFVTKENRHRLRAYYDGRREKMDLIEDIHEGSGDKSFQENRLNQIFKDEAESDKKETSFSLFFVKDYLEIANTRTDIKNESDTLGNNEGKESEYPDWTEERDYAIFIHNITFGLVQVQTAMTAVVIQQLGDEAKDNESSLYNRFLETYKRRMERSKNIRFENWLKWRSLNCCLCGKGQFRLLCQVVGTYLIEVIKGLITWLILMSTRAYIVFWILGGASCLAVGIILPLDAASPLYTTGQTWAGIAVTIGYNYFGLDGKNAPKLQEAKDAMDQKNSDAVQRALGGGAAEAKFTNDKGETTVIKSRHELEEEINRYDELRNKALGGGNRTEDSRYGDYCLSKLIKLKPLFPTAKDLKKQIEEAQKMLKKAMKEDDYCAVARFAKEVIELEAKKEKEKALDGGYEEEEKTEE